MNYGQDNIKIYKHSKLGILNKANIEQELYINFYAKFTWMSDE